MSVPGVPGMGAKASPQPFKSTFADMAFHRSAVLLLMHATDSLHASWRAVELLSAQPFYDGIY